MIRTNARCRLLERTALLRRNPVERALHFVAGKFELRDRRRAHAIEALGVFEHGCIAARADVPQNLGDGRIDGRILRAFEREQCPQFGGKVGRRRIESPDRGHLTAPVSASSSG